MRIIFTIIIITLIASCNTTKPNLTNSLTNLYTPPGTLKIDSNYFIDETEITNISWLEYLFWLKKFYGENSYEFKNALPDSTVWSELHTSYSDHDQYHLKHRAYRDHPVVGISYNQAQEYSKWRSDRVMEFLLFRGSVVPAIRTGSKDSLFTIKKYFNGNYLNLVPDTNYLYYPQYTLPDTAEYSRILNFSNSLMMKNFKSCKKTKWNDPVVQDNWCFENLPNKTESLPYGIDPTKNVHYFTCKRALITHLKGNVREFTNVKNIVFGNSYYDSTDSKNNNFRQVSSPNAYTGFRNICRYKKWNEN